MPFQPSLMFVNKAKGYLSGAPFRHSTLGPPANIRLGWKGLPGTKNTLTYCGHS